jgi:ribosomal protein S18 acetylase RimI-like enzyme
MIPTLRPATPDDAELIATLTRAAWISKPANSSGHCETADGVRANLLEGDAIIMELGGAAIGSLRLYPVYQTLEDGSRIGPVALEIARLGILPAYRGRGLNTWLMNEAMMTATKRGIEELRLAVRGDEPGLQRFYERQGFIKDSSIAYSHANPDSPPPITMRKYLFSTAPIIGTEL